MVEIWALTVTDLPTVRRHTQHLVPAYTTLAQPGSKEEKVVVDVQDAPIEKKGSGAAPAGGEDDVDFKEVSIPEALDILKVGCIMSHIADL